ncbi:MAG: hypothetical protein ABIG61_14140 [Planctomycetota bacterium]
MKPLKSENGHWHKEPKAFSKLGYYWDSNNFSQAKYDGEDKVDYYLGDGVSPDSQNWGLAAAKGSAYPCDS